MLIGQPFDSRRNPLKSLSWHRPPTAILRSVLYASGSGGHGCSHRRNFESLYVDGRGHALLWVAHFVKRHLLPFNQAAQTSTLDGADVNENVGATHCPAE